MSNQVNNAFVQQFADSLIQMAQQNGSRLQSTVTVKSVTGKYAHFDRLAATAAVKRTSRHGDTPQIDTPHSRRRLILEDYEWADLIDNQDELRMLVDPTSMYAKNGADALGRTMDAIIRDAAVGNARSISSTDTSTNVAFDTTMVVDEDFGSADSNLTFEKLNEARKKLKQNNIDMNEPMFCIVNASALASLLTESEIQSIDTNTVRALVAGELDTFMGFKFIHYEDLTGVADGTDTDPVDILCYAKSAVGLGLGQDIKVRISERDDKSYATQVYASLTAGAVRIEEEKIAIIECVQAA
jgi:hypothetical protein